MSKYKALMLDLDGTLLSKYDDLPSHHVTEAINKAKEKIAIGLATSRPFILLKPILEHLQLNGPSITQGGSRIINSITGNVLWEQPIPYEDVKEVCKILSNFNVLFVINDDGKYHDFNNNYVPYKPLSIWVKQIISQELGNKIVEALSNISAINATTAPASIDKEKVQIVVTHQSATKQHGILETAKILGIETKEIIGVGDGYNDFPLLMACGLKIAMGNANEDLKSIADYIAPTADQDGVADIIEKFVLN